VLSPRPCSPKFIVSGSLSYAKRLKILSKGRTAEGFDKLDKFGAIQEIADDAGRLAAIAERQIEALKAQRSSLIIAPTHSECRAIAGAVRQAMKEN
jgi:hypothetical protein